MTTHTKRVTKLTKLDTIVDPKPHDLVQKVRKSVKNPRAPIGITPDACGHILWANNEQLAHNFAQKVK